MSSSRDNKRKMDNPEPTNKKMKTVGSSKMEHNYMVIRLEIFAEFLKRNQETFCEAIGLIGEDHNMSVTMKYYKQGKKQLVADKKVRDEQIRDVKNVEFDSSTLKNDTASCWICHVTARDRVMMEVIVNRIFGLQDMAETVKWFYDHYDERWGDTKTLLCGWVEYLNRRHGWENGWDRWDTCPLDHAIPDYDINQEGRDYKAVEHNYVVIRNTYFGSFLLSRWTTFHGAVRDMRDKNWFPFKLFPGGKLAFRNDLVVTRNVHFDENFDDRIFEKTFPDDKACWICDVHGKNPIVLTITVERILMLEKFAAYVDMLRNGQLPLELAQEDETPWESVKTLFNKYVEDPNNEAAGEAKNNPINID